MNPDNPLWENHCNVSPKIPENRDQETHRPPREGTVLVKSLAVDTQVRREENEIFIERDGESLEAAVDEALAGLIRLVNIKLFTNSYITNLMRTACIYYYPNGFCWVLGGVQWGGVFNCLFLSQFTKYLFISYFSAMIR